MKRVIMVGCCGFPISREKYYQIFSVVELQQTFYQLPMLKTALKWKEESPMRFEFTMKVSQLITHEATSPTYRRYKTPIPEEKRKNYGSFRPTEEVMGAWQKVREIAQALKARILVFQCPPSFDPTPEHKENLRHFFSTIERGDFILVWEPRGHWKPTEIKKLCMELDLVHGVDPFKDKPLHGKLKYFRLHGKTGYSYRFTEEDLEWLKTEWAEGCAYFMFNNISMLDDSKKFMSLLKD